MSIRSMIAAAAVSLGVLAPIAASADEFQRWVDIVNLSDNVIASVHAVHVYTADWGTDLLARIVLPGEYQTVEPVNHQGYCRFDVLITFTDGTEVMVPRANLCEATEIVTDGGDFLVL